MAETADDLSAPLGQTDGAQEAPVPAAVHRHAGAGRAARPVSGRPLPASRIFTDNPLGGEPIARIALHQAPADEKPVGGAPNTPSRRPKSAAKAGAAGEQKTVTIIDGSSGKRQDVVDRRAKPPTRPRRRCRARDDGRHRSAPAGKIALRHDSGGRRRTEAVHGLRGRSRPRQGGQDARGRHRRRRPWRRRRQDHRRHHEAAAGGDAGVYALRVGSRPSSPNGRGRSATRSCCRSRWSRSTIPTTIPVRRPC